MPDRTARATWRGDLKSGEGRMEFDSGPFTGDYTFATRFESSPGTNPEELVGAAHAGCFSMQLSALLAQDGHTPTSVRTEARVSLSMEGSPHISKIVLDTRGEVPGIDAETFRTYAEKAKETCPISKALSMPIEVNATLS